jgi:hypothetical protein
MRVIRTKRIWPTALGVGLWAATALGQAVDVTMRLDQPYLAVGQTTTLRVLAAIDPALTNQSEQIFSWYIDLLNGSGAVAQAEYGSLSMTNGDNLAGASSGGITDQPHRRGIYNTFMNRPGAGRGAPVELLSVTVTAMASGTAVFSVQPGTTVSNLAHDFIVATTNQASPFTGGDYAAASAALMVRDLVSVSIARATNGLVRIAYPVVTGLTYRVEFRDNLLDGPDWQAMAGAPHNAGALVETNAAAQRRSYRVISFGP